MAEPLASTKEKIEQVGYSRIYNDSIHNKYMICYTSLSLSLCKYIQNNPCMNIQMVAFHYISAFMTFQFLEVLGPGFLCGSNGFDRA